MKYTDQQKRMFYTSGYFNRWKLNFQEIDLTIDNETIHTESPVVKESICEKEDLVLGGCIASSFSFEVSEIIQHDLSGIEFIAQLETVSEDGKESLVTPMGRYRVDSAETLDDKDYKQVTAYDALYDVSDNVLEWYQSFFANDQQHTVKETRVSLLEYFGIPVKDQKLVNDDVLLNKTIEPGGSLAGTTVLRALCEINGGFGRMDRQGCFEVIYLQGLGVFPEDQMGKDQNVYPEDTPGQEILYPEDNFEYLGISDYVNDYPEWRSIQAEDYMTLPISCLNIKDAEDGTGITIGDDLSNPYVITGNLFLYGKLSKELSQIGTNILSKIKGITYRPNTTELNGLPYMETGDVYAMMRKNGSVESYILSRSLKGIGTLIDTYEAKGGELRANEVSASEEIMQIKGRTLKLSKSIDGISSELTDFEKNTASKFEQTDESISAEVKKREDDDKELSGRIDVTAGQIVLKVDANGKIVAVELTADPKDGTEFKVEADNISLTAEEVINLIAGGTLSLSSKKIKIESDNFLVDENGYATVYSMDILGGSINIGDKFVVDENGICSTLEGDFTIQAKNLDLTAEEVISLMAGSTLSLSAKDIKIESDNLNIDTDGTVNATALNIEGGSINLTTSEKGEGLIHLKNVSWESSELVLKIIHFYGYGKPIKAPNGIEIAQYLDLSTGIIYRWNRNDTVRAWKRVGTVDRIDWQEAIMSTSDGFIASTKTMQPIEDGSGTGNTELYTDSNTITHNGDSILFEKNFYRISMGVPRQYGISGNISIAENGYDENNNPIPAMQFDIPVITESIFVGEGELKGEGDYITSSKNFLAPNIGDVKRADFGTVLPQDMDNWYPTAELYLDPGVYMVVGQTNFSSVSNSGTKACRITFDGDELSRSQVATAWYTALQCTAIVESSGGTVSVEAQHNTSITGNLAAHGYIQAVQIK